MIVWLTLGRAGVNVNVAVGAGLAATVTVWVATSEEPPESVTWSLTTLPPDAAKVVAAVWPTASSNAPSLSRSQA